MNPRVFLNFKRTQEYEHSPIQEPSQTSRELRSMNTTQYRNLPEPQENLGV
jgi:hypothetical protein